MLNRNRYKRKQTILLMIFSVAVFGLGIGFAAFSTTLNITSSASVSPDSSAFAVHFKQTLTSAYEEVQGKTHSGGVVDTLYPVVTNGASGDGIYLVDTSASGLKAYFTAPGQSVTYNFYVVNDGQYNAYLNKINFLNVSGKSSNKVCTAGVDATASLVEGACNSISISASVGDVTATETETLYNNVLPPGGAKAVSIVISYESNGTLADGEFSIEFGDIQFDYSSVDSTES